MVIETHEDSHDHADPGDRRERRPSVDEHPGGQEHRRETRAEQPRLRTFFRVIFPGGKGFKGWRIYECGTLTRKAFLGISG